MTHRPLSTPYNGLRVFSASLLSALLIMMPFVQMAAATRANARVSGVRSPESGKSEANAAAENVLVNPGLPGPVAVPLVPSITATMTDTLINDDGDSKADPTNGVPATTEKIRYTVTISNAGGATDATNVTYTNTIDSHTELVPGSVTTQPIAVNDSFNVLGNVRIQVPDGSSDLLGNDCDPDPAGGPCTNAGLTASGPTTGPTNGQATLNGDGSFSYNPNPGYTGADSFTYTVTDATGKTDTATVNLTISGMIWFVDDSAGGGGDGRLTSPFNCLTGAGCFNLVAADDPGDNIFLYSGTYNNTSVFALLDTQKLIGQGSSSGTTLAAIAGVTVPTHSDALPPLNNTPSTVTVNSTAAGIQLEQDNTLRGFTVGNTIGTGSNYDIQNTTTQTVGTLNISEVVLNGTGGLFRADSGGALSVTFNSAATTDAGGNGIQISNATGSFTVNGAGAISGVDGADVLISGGTATIAISSSISNTLGRAVDIQDRSGNPIGGITFSAAITDTGGQGIFLDDNDQGGGNGAVTFSGGLTLNPAINNTAFTATNGGIVNVSGTNNITTTGTGLGINWNGDTSASTVTFNNVTSATGAAVTIANSGATDFTFNDVTSTTGTAVDINIATGDFIFHKITKNGGSTGIDVDSATGSFTVNGDSTTAGTGGTIQNTTSHGAKFISSNNITLKNMNLTSNAQTQSSSNVNCGNNLVAGNTTLCTANLYLSSVSTISLTNLSITGSTQEGIAGTSVSALTLANSTIENNGNEDYENGFLFKNLTGTVSITNTNIRNNFSRQGHIFNDGASSLTLNVTGTVFGRTVAPLVSSQQGLLMELQGTTSTNVDVGTSSFNNNGNGNGLQINAASSATVGTVGTHSSVHNSTSMTNNAAHVFVNTSGSATMYFDTMNNAVMTAAGLQSIDYFANGGNLTGIIQGNTIGTNGVAASGCATALGGCDGMTIDKALTGNLSLRIESNTIQQINTNGIALGGANSGGSINASIINNTIRQPSNSAPANSQGNAIYLNMGAVNPSAFTACLNVTGNTISDTASNTWDINGSFAMIYVRARNTATVRIPGAAAGTAAAADTHITNNNTFTRVFVPNVEPVLTEAVGGGTYANGAACSVPLLLADGGVDAISFLSALTDLATNASGDRHNLGTMSSLNQSGLDAIVAAATQRWMATGLTQQQIAAMRELRFEVGDLANSFLGEASGNRIVVDRNAQGKGWFIDTTPADDVEFGTTFSATRRYTNPYTAAAGRVDLLTAIEHEIGHRLGLDDSYAEKDRDSIMYGYLTVGERRVPAQGQAINARPGSLMGTHFLKLKEVGAEGSKQKAASRKNHAATSRAVTATISGETITIIIGTLRPGDSVTITYDVTVNNPPDLNNPVNPLVVTQPAVATQGSVSYNDGVTPQTPVLTDEVAGGAVTPTETPVDLFDSQTTLASNLNPSNSGDNVTFTATVAIHPSQVPTPPSPVTPTGTVSFFDTLGDANPGNDVTLCSNVALNGSAQAQCSTTSLASGVRTIEARYSGDGNYDPSTGTLSQTVVACVTNPVVDIVGDEDDADCVSGDCSLREAIKTACSGSTITFDAVGVFATAQTITLTLGELSVTRNVTIDAPDGANHVTVSGGNASRVFNINPGKTVTMRELTITGGSTVGGGGGILNDHGTLTLINMTVSGNTSGSGGGINVDGTTSGSASLTVINSTISGNTSTSSGGGIYSFGTGGAATLIITNSTISGNNADIHGGGLYLSATTSTLTNVTVTNNRADNDNTGPGVGGGLAIVAGALTTLHNTIVAGNFNEDGVTDARDDVNGALEAASSFNLIGDGTGMTGITHGTNSNQVGTGVTPINALLAALADNGGLTFTHALQPTSPAVEAGSNTISDGAGLTTDQRGTGYPRKADSADTANTTDTVDIGAFELHPSIENIGDKTTAEDTAFNFDFNIGDDSASLITSVVATSSNQTLVPDANLVETDGTANDGVWNLSITPAADANSPAHGTATITVTVTASNGRTAVDTFVVTVTEVNDAPVPTNDTVGDIGEDCSSGCTAGKYVIPFATLLGNDTNKGAANESGQTVNITAVSAPTGGTVAINGTDVEFTPTANFFGAAGFSYTVTDNGTTNAVSDPQTGNATVSFNVTAVNDPPSFTIAGNPPAVNEDAGAQTVNSFATSISAGPGESQTLTFNITPTGTTGNLSFASGPSIDSTTGNLTYTTNADTNGTASFDVTLSDNGGGTDTSGTQSFTITVNAVNDAPTFQIASNPPAVNEDAGAQTVNSFATNFQPGPVTATDEGSQTLVSYTLTPTGTTGGLTFSGTPAIDTAGTLTYTATNNTSGTATFDVVATDSGSGTAPNVNQSAPVSFTITVNSANDAPENTVPGAQGTAVNTPLTFSGGNGNQISVADADAGTNAIKVTLSVTNGTLTLNGTAGLDFSGTCSGAAGDGTADTTMTFCGTLTDINNALNGMTYNPTTNFSGGAVLTITSDDQGNTGGAAQTDTDMVNIQVAANLNINDAQVPEPSSGTVDMTFTVALNAPAGSAVSVNFQTNDGTANAGTCGNPGADYVSTSGTVSFAVGEQVKTINVPVCSDNVADNGETFTVTLSSPSGATVIDGTATGTITANTAGTVLISELRTSGPGGAGDDFVEIYNNSNSPLTVAASDASAGYGLYKMGADCNATPVLIGVIPNGTVIPARGHYLFVGSAYSLANYGGTGAAAGNLTLSSDIETDANVGLFTTSDVTQISSVSRLDAVGFGVNIGGACNLLREGSTLPPIAGNATLEHSYFRKQCDWLQGQGCTVPGIPKDTNNNANDFWLADTAGSPTTGRLGAPGPENLASPIRRDNAGINLFLLDGTVGSGAAPNRTRKGTDLDYPGSAFGTMTLRYRVTNNTGGDVTRLRYRIVDISTGPSQPGPTADLRALTGIYDEDIPAGNDPPVGPVNDSTTCTSQSLATPCTVTVNKTTLETPPNQTDGGGYNSTLSSGTITTGTPLPNGQSILLNFKLGVEKTGTFRFYIIIEALP